MATISENLQTIKTSTTAIKQAIIDKGGKISGDITTWADAINAIKGGGITLLGGIKNKLNGAQIVIPAATSVIDGDVLYEYQYENLDTTTYSGVYIYMPAYRGAFPAFSAWGGVSPFFDIFNLGDIKFMMMERSRIDSGWVSGFQTDSYTYCLIPKHSFCGHGDKETSKICYCATSSHGTTYTGQQSQICCIFLVGQRKDNSEWDILDCDTFYFSRDTYMCFKEDTEITLSDLSKKKIQDITYNDKLLVWDFNNGCMNVDNVFWITKE